MDTNEIVSFNNMVKYTGSNIWINPVCDFFKISLQNQQRKLKNDPILGNLWTKKSTDLGEIDKNGRILLSKKGFVRWIQLINPNTIDEFLREKFIKFQEWIFDFIYGSAQENEQTQTSYRRLQKLERLKDKITAEIKREKSKISNFLESKFQTKLNFPEN